MLEIDRVEDCVAWIERGPGRPPAALQALDLRSVTGLDTPDAIGFGGCLFLGCELTAAQAGALTLGGAMVLHDGSHRPFSLHRARLYTPDELFAGFDPADGDGWQATFDARVYRHFLDAGGNHPADIAESLAQRLHDHAITDALDEALAGRRPVAIMGGHDIERADPAYAAVAGIARTLTRRGFLMVSGGGPGAMEATHLGAWMAHFDDGELAAALDVLAPRPAGAPPGREYADPDWLHRAMAVRERWPLPVGGSRYDSLGVPTWAYGHEPPAPFATLIAKYFANSVREDGLLAIATDGVVFTPGNAGTIQEIFQDATQNHYEVFGKPSPMILFGSEHWTHRYPVWPVLTALSAARAYADLVVLTDDPDEVVDRIVAAAAITDGV
jgi:predicted Rossmann-fold nucleotide-binding protein